MQARITSPTNIRFLRNGIPNMPAMPKWNACMIMQPCRQEKACFATFAPASACGIIRCVAICPCREETPSMHLPRSSGILLHPTALPGPHGIGALGTEARAFVDFLAAAGQSVWQVLPLGPTGYGASPYNALSAFAGNPLLIDLPTLVAWGDLDPVDLEEEPPANGSVDFSAVHRFKESRL